MIRFYKYIICLYLTILIAEEIALVGDSSPFIADTQYPLLDWISPVASDEIDGNETILLEWDIEEESLQNGLVSIYFSTTISPQYDLILSGLGNEESVYYTLPNINTDFARFKITVEDDFGYQSEVTSEYFTINASSGGDDGGDDGGQYEDLILIGDSESFVADTQPPEVEFLYPNGGESFNQGQAVSVSWSASDESLGDNPIAIFLTVNQGANYESQAEFIANSGMFTATLPMQDTEYGRFKVTVIDLYGYESTDVGDAYFSIGATNEYAVSDTSLVLQNDSESFRTDTVDPVITVIYPNGGEHVIDYENVNLQWTVEDESIDNIECSASVISQLGGYYIVVDDNLPVLGYENSYDVNMNQEGVEESLWARLKMDITDSFGNSGFDKSDDYFILGDPEGTMETESVDIMASLNLLDWSWQSDQLFTFKPASLSFLNDGDELVIVDDNAIVNSSCEGDIGPLDSVSFIFNSDMAYSYVSLKTYQGADYCEQGGVRYSGYVLGNDIVYQVRYTNGSTLELIPDIDTGESVFNDSMVVINSFENVTYPGCIYGTVEDCSGDGDCCSETWIGDGIADCEEQARGCDLSCYMEDAGDCTDPAAMLHIPHEDIFIYIANDRGRDFEDFNIYRSVKHSIELARDESDCTGTCGNCSDNLTFEQDDCIAHGVCDYYFGDPSDQITEDECCIQFDIDICAQDLANWTPYTWTDKEEEYNEELDECTCLIVEHINQNWYFDSFSISQNQWCYQVYLMDGDTKLVNTVQSCNDVNSYYNYTTGDFNFDSAVNVLDILILSTHILEINVISSEFIISLMDVNSDDTLNILDIMVVMNIILAEAE